MFGFKTKKDKRIEELENQLSMMYMKTPTIVSTEKDIHTIRCAYQLDEYMMPIKIAKNEIKRSFMDKLEDEIIYDIQDFEGKKVLYGTLSFVSRGVR